MYTIQLPPSLPLAFSAAYKASRHGLSLLALPTLLKAAYTSSLDEKLHAPLGGLSARVKHLVVEST